MAGQALRHLHQLGVGCLLERRHLREQRRIVDAHLKALCHRHQLGADGCAQLLHVHAWQRAQVEFQGALAADTVGVVAAVDAAEVHGRGRYGELRVAVGLLPLLAQAHQLAHHRVHGLHGAAAQAWVRGVAAAPEDVDAVHEDALVHADRPQPGRLTDYRCTAQWLAGLGQGTGAGHGAFFVAGGKDQQRLLEVVLQQRDDRFDDQGEEALHVAAAQADPTAIGFGQLQWVTGPQLFVIGYGVAVPRQHQATRASATAGQQVELAGADLLDVALETQVAQPAGQQVDDLAVGLVQRGLGATDRRRGDQGGKLVFQRRQRHAHTPRKRCPS
ncbi:hypothetical protein D3C76_555070 [compost metagenome]